MCYVQLKQSGLVCNRFLLKVDIGVVAQCCTENFNDTVCKMQSLNFAVVSDYTLVYMSLSKKIAHMLNYACIYTVQFIH